MLIIKNTGMETFLNKTSIKDSVLNKYTLALVNRNLNYKDIVFGISENSKLITKEFIDDITQEEIKAGTQAVKEYCKNNNCLDLYHDYILAIANTDAEKLEASKEKKKYEINQKCKEIINSGFEFEGNIYQSDENSQKDIANTASTNRTDIKWITKDNQIIDFTNEKFKEFHSALNKFIQDNVIKARMIKNELNLAKTIKKVEALKW